MLFSHGQLAQSYLGREGVFSIEARKTKNIFRQSRSVNQAVEAEVTKRISAQVFSDPWDGHLSSNKFPFAGHIYFQEAGMAKGGAQMRR